MVVSDGYVSLADGSPGCLLDSQPRRVQNGSRVYYVALKQEYLALLNICEQGAPTMHSVATKPVKVSNPAYIIQPAEVLDG